MTALFYFISTIAILQGIFGLIDGMRSARHIRTFRPRSNWRPRVVVICPCKGTDAEFRANALSILSQDYPDARVVFVVESDSDPALPELRDIGAAALVAGISTVRSQKVHNMIHAVEASGDADVFVFCDSDARFPGNWITNLIAPLEDKSVAVATGYRWYSAASGSLPSLFRSIWNASAVTALGDHSRNFAWGGSMAIRRETFERIGVRDAWDRTVSDDMALTLAARKAGGRIVFVPSCLIPSHGDCTWRELLEFTTRQIIIVRVFDPGLWRVAFIGQTVFNIAFWWALVWMWRNPAAPGIWLILYALSAAKSAIRLKAVSSVLSRGILSNPRWSYILLTPLSALLYEYNMLRSAFTRDIVWRHRRYTMISPRHTVIQHGAREN
jgi:ceramide glucosyltransferase